MGAPPRDPVQPPRPASGAEPPAISPEPRPRPKVAYPRMPGSAGNLVLWTFAGIGFVALGAASVWLMKRAVEAPRVDLAGALKPIVWKPLPHLDEVLVTIDVAPNSARARLLLDGDPLPSNPVLLPRGTVHRIHVVADGYEAEELEVKADARKTVRVELERAR
jgi:hypothetical protein